MATSLPWVDDFDILEFARYSNKFTNCTQAIDIDALARRLAEAKILTQAEYEGKKSSWKQSDSKSRVDEDMESAYREMMPQTKRVKISSPLSDFLEMVDLDPRYCKRFYTSNAKKRNLL